MKKLTASIFTVLLATVGAANAEIASRAYVDGQIGNLPANSNVMAEIDAAKSVATSGTTTALDALDLATVGGTGTVIKTVSQENGKVAATAGAIVDADIDSNAAIAQSKISGLSDALAAKAAASDLTALGTKVGDLPQGITATTVTGYVAEAVAGATSATTDAIGELDATVSQAAGTDGLALQVVETDGVLTSVTGSIAANTYDAYGAASDVQTALEEKIGTVPNGSTVMGEINSLSSNAVKTVQVNGTALTATNGVVNVTAAEGATNGTIAVNGADVAVHGLGSAAYTESTAYTPAVDAQTIASDGTYVLTMKVVNNNPTYAWEQITRAAAAQQGGGD